MSMYERASMHMSVVRIWALTDISRVKNNGAVQYNIDTIAAACGGGAVGLL